MSRFWLDISRKRKAGFMTTVEYLRTPESALPQELIHGAWHVADAPYRPHQEAVGQLFLALSAHLQDHPVGRVWLSPFDVVLDTERAVVVQPDLVYVRHGGEARVDEHIYGAPDLAIEVLSPKPRVGRTGERLKLFAKYGVRECWLVPIGDRRIDVLAFESEQLVRRTAIPSHARMVSTVLPDFTRTPASIFGYGF